MRGFRIYCRRCKKLDVECMMCLATTTTCVMYAKQSHQPKMEWYSPHPSDKPGELFFGRTMLKHTDHLTDEEREEIDLMLVQREMGIVSGG